MNSTPPLTEPSTIAVLSAEGITKRFGATLANDSVSLTLRPGSIHALLGENGAGKSTLVSILYGLIPADAGRLSLFGRPVRIRRPGDALEHGIGLVQQHFSLIPAFSVLDNLMLGREAGTFLGLSRQRAEQEIETLLESYGLRLPLRSRVETLPVGIRQQVEIARILVRKARIMLFDEPTATLVAHEVDRFLETLRNLAREGIAVLLITHRLPEVMQAADEVTVLRKGRVAMQAPISRVTPEAIAQAIIGEELPHESYELPPTGKSVLCLEEVTSEKNNPGVPIRNLTFTVNEREIFGIAGVAGNGQESLIDLILGIRALARGSIRLADREIGCAGPAERREQGLAFSPQDRQKNGLLLDHSLWENFMLNPHAFTASTPPGWSRKQLLEPVRQRIRDYRIQPESPDLLIRHFSGGHQQRALIARELGASPKLIVAHDPTHGLDIPASRFVHERLILSCRAGAGVLLFSSELSELLLLCRRIGVLYRGNITEIRAAEAWTVAELSRAMVGAA